MKTLKYGRHLCIFHVVKSVGGRGWNPLPSGVYGTVPVYDSFYVAIFYGVNELQKPFPCPVLIDSTVPFDYISQTTIFRVLHYDENSKKIRFCFEKIIYERYLLKYRCVVRIDSWYLIMFSCLRPLTTSISRGKNFSKYLADFCFFEIIFIATLHLWISEYASCITFKYKSIFLDILLHYITLHNVI